MVDGNNVNMIVEYRSDLNGGLQEGFWIGEFGIFGKVANGAETMIGYGSPGRPQAVRERLRGRGRPGRAPVSRFHHRHHRDPG